MKSTDSAPEAVCVCCPGCGCGSGDAEAVTETRDFELADDRGAFSVVKCRGCGLSYTSLRPRFDVLAQRHHPSNYLCYGRQGSAGQAALDRMRRAKQAAVRADLLARLLGMDRKKRVLEVGCATGEFLEVCRDRHGYEVEGIEPDAQLAERLCKKGIEVQASSLERQCSRNAATMRSACSMFLNISGIPTLHSVG